MKHALFNIISSIFILLPSIAFAHHPLAGMPMVSFSDGILSGVGHPLLGFDHLFFVALVGVVALFTGQRYLSPVAYITAMLIGCMMMVTGIELPVKEAMVGLSLLGLGALVLSGQTPSFFPALLTFFVFGLFHGSAFGDAIAAQEASVSNHVLTGYLLGLGVIQYVIALTAGWVHLHVLRATGPCFMNTRLVGAVVAGIGLFLTIENLEAFFFNSMGWVT
tara:strand:- start:887 stop:1546 length:660 start_codon:yes stop_codon:yes gene_type:complete